MNGAFETFFSRDGIVFDPATGKLNTQAPVSPIGVEGDFLVSYWVGNALIRNGFRPSPVKEGQINIDCRSAHHLVMTMPDSGTKVFTDVAGLIKEMKNIRL